ncbi:putative signaling protein PA1727 [Deinococcus xinjiangensis]|uniref:Signaling protein PA1727 n=2 Tax=Deinococcus xinjiangensis TaxID=457454 RepID=A0ABP9VFI5_9DEIO
MAFLGAAQLLYLWAFLAFGHRRGLYWSLTFYAASLALGAAFYLFSLAQGSPQPLQQTHAFFYVLSPLYIAIMSAMASLNVYQSTNRVQALTQALYTDPLTGLPNRAAFQEALGQAVGKAKHSGQNGTLALLNINEFVRINDELGHTAGDLALKTLAQRWRAALPPEAHLSRVSGDEFALLLQGSAKDSAEAQIRQLLEVAQQPLELVGVFRTLSVRCGAAYFPENGTDAAAVNIAADLAGVQARRSHRGLVVYSPQLALSSDRRRRVLSALAQAPERGELRLVYQPICSLSTGQVESVEALLRWDSSLNPPTYPEEFIALAEEAALMKPLGDWVLTRALEQMSEWQAQGLNVPRMNVNVSPQEVMRGNYAERTLQKLSEFHLSPSVLELELTERTVLQETALLQLRLLRSAGVYVSIDDFGTGHSSLGRLHSLPITGVKLDRSFIAMLGQDGSADRLSRTVLTLARALNLEVVAEGIETEPQLALLRELACPLGQGYLFTRPLAPADFAAYLRRAASYGLRSIP